MKKTIKERLIEFVSSENMSQREFERICGFSYGFLSHLGDNISQKSTRAIKQKFSKLNVDWLLTGEGNMIQEDISSEDVIASGEQSTAVKGNNNQVNSASFVSVMNRAFDEIAAQRTLTQKRDEQIDRLLTMLELKIK